MKKSSKVKQQGTQPPSARKVSEQHLPRPKPVSEKVSPAQRRRYLREARQRQERMHREQRRLKLHQPTSIGRRRNGKQTEVAEHSGPVMTTNWLENQERAEREQEVREIPGWLGPLIALLLLLLMLFIVLPLVLQRVAPSEDLSTEQTAAAEVQTIYGDQYLLSAVPAISVYAEPDIRAGRIAQFLYNQPLERADRELDVTGFLSIKIPDGRVGYVRSDEVSQDMSPIEPARYDQRLVVTDVSKNIMSHASNGNVVVEVFMGTELFVTYEGGALYRVALPGGEEGWLSSAGVIALGKVEPIPETTAAIFANTASAFSNSVLQDAGIAIRGMSIEGAARIAARVNGKELPFTMEQQITELPVVSTVQNENGTINYERFREGDLLYFSRDPAALYEFDPERDPAAEAPLPDKMGIWTDYGIILTDVPRRFILSETEVRSVLEEYQLISVRRPFEN